MTTPNSSTLGGEDEDEDEDGMPCLLRLVCLATKANVSRSEIVLGVRGKGGRGSDGARVGGGFAFACGAWCRDDVDADA